MKQKSLKRRKNGKKLLRGFTTIAVLIILVIFGSIMMVGGLFPTLPEGSGSTENTIDESSLKEIQNDNLQLGTFRFKECGAIAAVNFLVDNSGSMRGEKIRDLKDGMKAFAASYPDDGIIGIQAYNQPGVISAEGYKEMVPISKYADVKPSVDSAIESMQDGGYTYSKNAMSFSKTKLQEGIAKYPEFKFNLVFISDGIPETAASNQACGTRCLAQEQNPTSVAAEIKAMGVRIFTLAYLDDGDARLRDELRNMMINVASSPDDFYVAPVSNQIDQILVQIGQKVCS